MVEMGTVCHWLVKFEVTNQVCYIRASLGECCE